ncbi:MAG TPA: hypothetical protein VK002_04175 [Rubricoccaceae bacterium]|nr:hypothetical protein [Rubricoccaceae bacterium]
MSVLRVLCRCCLLAGALLVCDAGALRAQDTTDVPPPPPPLPEEAEPAPMPEPEPRETPPERPPPPPAPRPQPERPPRPQETPQAPPRTQPPPASATPAPQQEQAVGAPSPPDTAAPPPQPAAPPDPALAAFARIRAAAADTAGLAPRGPLPPMAPALAGVVWSQPADRAAALDALLAMRRVGVRAVRTGLVADTLLLAAADLLGVALYQDLPVANLPAPVLLDTLAFAERRLRAALALAEGHPSARHFGLALYSDTSDPRSRPYFERLTALAHEAGARTYYLTRFPHHDRAARTVDLVLLDARDADPTEVLARWRARHEEPAGIGAFGVAVRPGSAGGWRTPGTPAAQARALENGLGALLALDVPPEALFVYRWRDAGGAVRDQRAEVQGVVYGLVGADGAPRPALDVVRGFFTGTQRVFAFDAGAGPPEARTAAALVLLGWVILLGLGLLYWLAPRFGLLGSRYFGRHDLYRESIQRGYDLNAGLNSLLAAFVALAAGLVWASVLRALARTDALATATSAWSPAGQARLDALLGLPLVLVLLGALVYGLWILFNMIWLYALTGRRRRIRPPQALTLAVWSRWSVAALMVGAMILATLPARTATRLAPVLLGAWLVAEVVATGRMLYDFAHVSRVPMQRAVLVGFWAPVGALAVVVLGALLFARAELGFLWHLATRS